MNNRTFRKRIKETLEAESKPIEAEELTRPLNKYVVAIGDGKVVFTDNIWAAIEALIDKACVAARLDELEKLQRVNGNHYTSPLERSRNISRTITNRLSKLKAIMEIKE